MMSSKKRIKSSKLWYAVITILSVYFTQELLFASSGSLFSQGLVLIVILIGLYSFVTTIPSLFNAPRVMIWVSLFWLMLAVTYVLSPKMVISSTAHVLITTMPQFKGVTCFCMMLFIGYKIGKKQYLPPKQICITVILLLVMAFISFLQEALARTDDMSSRDTTNNSAYTFLLILIFVPIIFPKYKKIALAASSVIFVFVLAGAKRGAIICMAIMLLYVLYWYGRNFRIRVKTIAAIALVSVIAGAYVKHVYEENDYIKQRLDQTMEGNSSGRDGIYEWLWDAWCEADLTTQLIGRGSAQTVPIAGNFAHNDWLELLTDNGILGVVVYLMIFISLFHYVSRNHPDKYVYLSIMLWIIYWLAKSLFSMGYTSIFGGIPMMLVGLLIANIKYRKQLSATYCS